MRQIKFRGKRKDNGEWVVGSLVKIIRVNIKFYILPLNTVIDDDSKMFDSLIEIRPDTVSQFTGLVDLNGKDMYEGDIIGGNPNGYIKWDNEDSSYEVEYHAFHKDWLYTISYLIEIIGNIHDNPELLNPQ